MLKRLLLCLLATFLVFTVSAIAQDTATLTGRVLDPTGAVVVGAQVAIVNIATNIEVLSQTNAEGIYRVPALRPETYRITVTAAGFKKFVREGVELRVGATLLVNADLEIGAASDSVEVTTATPLLETETSATGTVVEGKNFVRLPFYQSYAMASLYMTPGALINGAGASNNGTSFYINGESYQRQAFFDDGVYSRSASTGYVAETPFDSIEEIKVLTTALPAEYGHASGGAVVVAKKTGTNLVHGRGGDLSSFGGMEQRYFFQMYKLNQPQQGLPKGSEFIVQQPDGAMDGPMYIPKIYDGRNKSFFSFAYKKYAVKEGLGQVQTVPTAAMQNGDFSFSERPAGTTIYPMYDPTTTTLTNGVWSRSVIPNNIIPKNTISPVASKFLALNPWTPPNFTPSWTATGPTNNFVSTTTKQSFYTYMGLRLDHNLTSKLRLFGTWSYTQRFGPLPDNSIAYGPLNNDGWHLLSKWYMTSAGVGGVYTISPTLISETRMNYFRRFDITDSTQYKNNWGSILGIPNIGSVGLPGGMPIGNSVPSVAAEENFEFKEDVTKVWGSHAFKMGFDLMRFRYNSHSADNPAGSFGIAGTGGINANGSGISGTGGNSLAAFEIGAASSYSVTKNLLSTLPRDLLTSLYFQDDWKISPTLTANLGMRWQVESPPNNKYGQQSTFNPTAPDNTDIGYLGVIQHPTGSMYKKDWNNFQPRVGLAWHPLDRIVVRSGFALNTVDHGYQSPPRDEYGSITATWNQPSGEYRPLFMLAAGPDWTKFNFPAIRADGSIPMSGVNYSGRGATWVDPNRVEAYTMNWNLGIQYKISDNYVVEGTYNGDRGVKNWESWAVNSLPYSYAWNMYQTNPTLFSSMVGNSQPFRPWVNFGGVSYATNGGNTIFHSGTIKLEKRYSRGLTGTAFYTYGKCISDSTSNIYLDRGEQRARCGYDRTHIFTGTLNYELPIGKGRKFLNRGGVLNAIFGGFDFVWVYQISSGNPVTFGLGGTTPQYMPGIVSTIGGRPNSTGVSAHLRNNWQDLGGNRFVQSAQNGMIDSMSDFTIPAAYTMGNVGANTMDQQRFIAANVSASKSWQLKERMKLQFRWDFQNPFKWYNWPYPMNTTVNYTNPTLFGTVTPSYTSEPGTASNGGVPLQTINLILTF